ILLHEKRSAAIVVQPGIAQSAVEGSCTEFNRSIVLVFRQIDYTAIDISRSVQGIKAYRLLIILDCTVKIFQAMFGCGTLGIEVAIAQSISDCEVKILNRF